MKAPIYVGCSMDIPLKYLEEVITVLRQSFGFECINFWNRHTDYDESDLGAAKAFLLVPPDNNFRFGKSSLTLGLYNELQRAQNELKIPIYLV